MSTSRAMGAWVLLPPVRNRSASALHCVDTYRVKPLLVNVRLGRVSSLEALFSFAPSPSDLRKGGMLCPLLCVLRSPTLLSYQLQHCYSCSIAVAWS